MISKNDKTSLYAAGLYALNPLAVIYSLWIGSETLFAFCFLSTVLACVGLFQKPTAKNGAMAGFLIGVSALVKPISVYFGLAFIAFMLIARWRGRISFKGVAKSSIVLILVFLATLSPWQMRNLKVYGHYSLTMQQGREMFVAMVGWCRSRTEQIPYKELLTTIEKPYMHIDDIFVRSQEEGRAALRYVKEDPVRFTGCFLGGVSNFISGGDPFITRWALAPMLYAFLHYYFDDFQIGLLNWIFVLSLWLAYILGLFGLFLRHRDRSVFYSHLIPLLAFTYIVVLTAVEGNNRYLYPVTPEAVIFFSISLAVVVRKTREYYQGSPS
jgi:hypothetical protein